MSLTAEHTRTHIVVFEQNTNGTTFSVVVRKMTDVTAGDKTCSEGVLWAVWSCFTSRALPNLVPVYCLFLQTYLLGIIISICGNVLISISLNIQVRNAGIQLHSAHAADSRHIMAVKTQFPTLLLDCLSSCLLSKTSVRHDFCEHTLRHWMHVFSPDSF